MLTATGNGPRGAIIEARERAHVPDLVAHELSPSSRMLDTEAGHGARIVSASV